MAVPFSNTKLRVPRGFQNLIEGFAREVLRSQPESIYEFGAKYFESLLKRREETGQDPADHEAAMEDRFYNNKAFTTKTVDISSTEQHGAATKIQTKYRQFAAKQDVDQRRQDQAAAKIQAGFRGFKDRARVNEMKQEQLGMMQSLTTDNVDASDILKRQIEDQDQQTAPIASGAQTQLSALPDDETSKISSQEDENVDELDPVEKNTHQAASIIQAGFRGMQTRKKISELKETSPQPGDDITDERIEGGEGEIEGDEEGKEEPDEGQIEGEVEGDVQAEVSAVELEASVVMDDQAEATGDEGLNVGEEEAQEALPAEEAPAEEAPADQQPVE